MARVTRREFIGASALAGVGVALGRIPASALQQQAPVTRFEELRGGVGFFTGQGGTIGWLATPDGAVAVDSQFPATAQACVDGLRQRSARGIELLVNSHHHSDHTSGNGVFRPAVRKIVQHSRCAELHRQQFERTTPAAGAPSPLADETFADTWSATIGSETIRARYYGPAHTGGDIVVTFERANVVHMGDLMFARMHPVIDRPAGASLRGWAQLLARVADEHRDATFIFGHAAQGRAVTGTRADLLGFRDYLSAVVEHAQKAVTAGQPVEELVKLTELPGFTDYTGNSARMSLANSLTMAYQELTAR